MKELIKIKTENGKQLVSARELYEFLGLSKRFSSWFETYSKNEDYGFIENEDFTSVLSSTVVNNGAERQLQDYAITIDMAKELSMLSKTEKGKQARKYFIQCEKALKENTQTLNTSELSPELQMFGNLYKAIANQELEQKKIKAEIEDTKNQLQGIRGIVAINSKDWKNDCKNLITKIAYKLGGIEHIQDVYKEVYSTLDKRLGTKLQVRLTNKRRRMADEGVCKSRRDKLNYINVIEDDKKLIEGYIAIVKELSIKYGVDMN